MRTSKKQPKQRVSKVTELIDKETGETVPVVQVSTDMEDRDFDFHKIWFSHFIQSLDIVSNQRLKLAFWIIDHLDSNNKLSMTQRQIAEESGISLKTVAITMKALQEGELPFLQRINGGTYIVNPAVIFKGAHGHRMAVMYDYNNTKKPSDSGKKKNTVTDINKAKDKQKTKTRKPRQRKERTA